MSRTQSHISHNQIVHGLFDSVIKDGLQNGQPKSISNQDTIFVNCRASNVCPFSNVLIFLEPLFLLIRFESKYIIPVKHLNFRSS